MSRIGEGFVLVWLAFAFAFAATAGAQPPASVERLSPVERQQSDFYGAVGTGVTAAWTVDPARVELGTDIELTLTVANAENPAELLRPNLADRPEWKAIFGAFRDSPDSTPGAFRYRLKPRNAGAFELPIPKYRFYNPRLPEGRRFQTAFAAAPNITVIPAVVVPAPSAKIPIDAPDRFLGDPPLSSAASASPPIWYWWVLLAIGATVPPAGIALWRWRNPDAAKLARIRRARSVRIALDALRKAERSVEPASSVSKIALRYLVERHRMPASAHTPREVSDALRKEGWLPETLGEVESILARCDAIRFGAGIDSGLSLVEMTRRWIERWEGAAA